MVLARFLPQDERFFQFFDDAASNAKEAAQLLVDLVGHYEDVERKVRRMADIERRGDEITHQVFNALNSTFVTPLDREDIRDLASKLDDFVDYIEEAARRMMLYHIEESTELARLLARILSEQADLIAEAVPMLEHTKQRDNLMRHLVEINRLENEGDDLLDRAMSTLYEGIVEVPALIKAMRWGELYQILEDATDRAEDVANTLEAIVLKHA
ncbi:MAG: DUF47 domain-containing protein [Chloroflexi bacterium]|nr:DUF47 domain-containing protein [Chloroflexota bacterium]